jgi:hypothetical protein
MSKIRWKYVLLTLSLAGIAITACDRQPTTVSYLALPLSAILFELFLIFSILEKESALFDEQNHKARPTQNLPRPRASQLVKIARPELTAQWN